MQTLFLQLILAVDIAALTWLFLLAGQRRLVRAFHVREMKLLMGLNQGVIVLDESSRIIALNKEARNLFPEARLNMIVNIDKELALLNEGQNRLSGKRHPLKRALKTKRSIALTRLWVEQGKKVIPVEFSAAFVPSSKDVSGAVVGLIRDASKEALIERMKSDFIGIASHQLRSPLASLKWYGEIFNDECFGSLSKQGREYLSRMNEATGRMINIIDDFLEASRLETNSRLIHIDEVDIVDLIKHIIATQKPFIEVKKLSVKTRKIGTIKPVYADPAMLRELFANFISNAIKYNKEKGKVLIQLQQKGKNIEAKIRDTGVGIPEEEQERIFSKFFRADNAVTQGFKGTGLGLYTAKMILQVMEGKVTFNSDVKKGTEFIVKIPSDQRKV
jgi:signal transduction histidine kinase